MKKTLCLTILFLVFLFLFFLQSNFFSWYNINGIMPNVFIILSLFIGLFIGRVYGFSCGVCFGIFLDFFISKRIGINAIILGFSGLLGGILDKSFSKDNRISCVMITMSITIFCEIVGYTLQIIMLGADAKFMVFIGKALIESIFNGIIVIVLYPLIQLAGYKLEDVFCNRNSLMKYY